MTHISRIDRLGKNLQENVPTAHCLGRNVRIHHEHVPGACPVARTVTVDGTRVDGTRVDGTMSAPIRFSLTVTDKDAPISPR